uniref:BPI2 domain-containing protein n=1 Tax=Parascaris univalens TaxID=6257 RepID=A0A915AI63_PARUN
MFSVLVAVLLSTVCTGEDASGAHAGFVSGRAHVNAYSTDARSHVGARSINSASVKGNKSIAATGFNPALALAVHGYPGIKFRLNQRAFQYSSTLIGAVLNSEIKRAHIPPIIQCIPQVNGCIQVYNLYVSRYRCAQRVTIYPAPPNRIIISVHNLDVGVSGNLGGQIVVLLPLVLSGIVHVNAHQVSVTVQLALERSLSGSPSIRIVGCSASVGYVDAYIQNGGLIGDIVNNQFRAKVSEHVREAIPSKLCEALPRIVSERINPKLAEVPQWIALKQIASLAGGIIGGNNKVPEYCSSPQCQKPKQQSVTIPPSAAISTNAPSISTPDHGQSANLDSSPLNTSLPLPDKQGSTSDQSDFQSRRSGRVRRLYSSSQYSLQSAVVLHGLQLMRTRRVAPMAIPLPFEAYHDADLNAQQRRAALAASSLHRANGVPTGIVASRSGNPCAGCPDPENKEQLNAVQDLLKALDINKLSDIVLTTQILRTYATPNDYTVELNGEFSPSGRGGTPFSPFAMYFPQAVGNSVADALLSDFTINSLIYQMQKKGFISFRVGPETPKIGELLKTTCADDDYSSESFEDPGVEIDDEGESTTEVTTTETSALRRRKREEGDDDGEEALLADLGICIGDIMPAVREAHPNKKLNILIHTVRAPSVIFSAKNGGTATLDLIADAEIFIDDTGEKVGTIEVTTVVEVAIKSSGKHISGTAQLKVLKLEDKDGTLGLPPDAFRNLANLGKDMVSKMVNDALANGFTVDVPTSGLPVSFVRPQIRIVDHAILFSADLIVSASLLGTDGESKACRNQK